MDWIEAQLDDESIFPQKLGMLKFFQIVRSGPYIFPIFIGETNIKQYNSSYFVVPGSPFPENFQDVVKTIFKRLFRVYAHIYHSHFQKIVSLKEEAHLNTCFKHFVLFTWVSFILNSAIAI